MTGHQARLTVDFGEVGYWNDKHPFRVELDAAALSELIDHAGNAHRIYELMLISRPGDVWDYVRVSPQAVPPRLAGRIRHAREDARPRYGGKHPWPDGQIPFPAFDRLFHWAGDDTEPEDEAWLGHRDSEALRCYARQLLSIALAAQSRIDWNDPLIRHEVERIRAGTHAYAFLGRQAALERCRQHTPNAHKHSADFYRQLEELLQDPELASVAYRGDGDYRVLRMLGTEQRRRAEITGQDPETALHLSALVNHTTNNTAWDSRLWFFSEGLAHGDLFIEEGGFGKPLKGLIEANQYRAPGRHILSRRDEGDLPGYERQAGQGWVRYRRLAPVCRRRGLELIDWRRQPGRPPVLVFEGEGSTLFEYDKTILIVGPEVAERATSVLASVIADWQRRGGDPLAMVFGDAGAFWSTGCHDVVQPEDRFSSGEPEAAVRWLRSVLWQRRRWIDVVMLLDAPPWAARVLADQVRHQTLWKPWVLATANVEDLPIDRVLSGDPAEIIAAARETARSRLPRRG